MAGLDGCCIAPSSERSREPADGSPDRNRRNMGNRVMRISICNEMFQDWPLEEVCAVCSELGYEGLELAPFTLGTDPARLGPVAIRAIRRTLQNHGMAFVGLHWLLAGTVGLHLTQEDPLVGARTVAHLRALIGLCAELGGGVMVLGSPMQRSVPSGTPTDPAVERMRKSLESLLPALESSGVVLALEPLGPEETNVVNTAGEAAEIVDQLGSPHLRLVLDVKAMATEQLPIGQIIRQHGDRLAHFHANDPNRLGPGMGSVDFLPILEALRDIDYRSWVSVEVFDFSPGARQIASISLANLKKACVAAGWN